MNVFYVGGPIDGWRVKPYHCDLDCVEVNQEAVGRIGAVTKVRYFKRLYRAPGVGEFLAFVFEGTTEEVAQLRIAKLYFPHNLAARSSALKLA